MGWLGRLGAAAVAFGMTCIGALSQQQDAAMLRSGYGAYGGIQLGLYGADFSTLPGVASCCQGFSSGDGIDPYVGLQYRLPMSSNLAVDLRAGLSWHSADFTSTEVIGNAIDVSGGQERVVDAVSEYTVATDRTMIEFWPRLSWYPVRRFSVTGGLHVGYVATSSFSSSERLVSPASSTYSDNGQRVRNSFTGSIPNLSALQIGVHVGAGYDLEMNDVLLTPEVSLVKPLTSAIDFDGNGSWDPWLVRVGVSVLFLRDPERVPLIVEPVAPTRVFAARVQAKEQRGTELRDVAEVTVTETLSTQVYPLLPFIFFGDGQSAMTQRYRRLSASQVRSFDPSQEFRFDASADKRKLVLDVYYNILNIVGRRMSDDPASTLTITGYNANVGGEAGARALSQARAEEVRAYLRDVWGIPEERLIMGRHGDLSPTAAKTNMADRQDVMDGHDENRRVELTSNPPSILFPVVVRDTARTIDKPMLLFTMGVDSDRPMLSWDLKAEHSSLAGSGRRIVDTADAGSPPGVYRQVFEPDADQRNIPKNAEKITYRMQVENIERETAQATNEILVNYVSVERKKRERIGDLEVNRYRLIQFPYESSGLQGMPEAILSDLNVGDGTIIDDVREADSVVISGYTDRKGTAESNLRLSTERAAAVRAFLVDRSKTASTLLSTGNDETAAPYPNDSPEERLYNRTVEVVVTRKAK